MPRTVVEVAVIGNIKDFQDKMKTAGFDIENTANKSADAFDKATSRIGKSFSGLGSLANQFGIPIGGVLDGIGAKFDAAKSKGEGLGGQLRSMGGTVAAAGAAGIAAVGIESIHLAESYETSRRALEAAVKASGGDMKSLSGNIQNAEGKMSDLGFTAADTDSALAKGTIATKSAGKAMDLLQVSADLARTKNISLQDAMIAVSRASEGQTRGLKQLGIDLPISAGGALKVKNAQDALSKATTAASSFLQQHSDAVNTSSKYHIQYEKLLGSSQQAQEKLTSASSAGDSIIDALSKRLGGQAQAATKGFHGQMEVASAKLKNVGVEIGEKLIPVVTKLAGYLEKVVKFLTTHKPVLIAIAAVIGVVLVGAMVAWIATIWASTAALLANPVTWIILAVIALVAAIVILAIHWKKIWNAIKEIVGAAWHFIKSHWELLLGIFMAPLLAVILVWKHFHTQITNIVKGIIDWIKSHWVLIIEILVGPLGIAFALFNHFKSQILGVFESIWKGIKSVWDEVVSGFQWVGNTLKSGADWIYNNVVKPVIGFFEAIPKGISSAFNTLKDIIVAPFKAGFNAISSLWNSTVGQLSFHLPSWIPGIGGDGFSMPKLPHLAAGGPLSAGQMALVGENGPELFKPSTSGSIIPNSKIGKAGANNITINANTNASARDIAREIGWALRTA